MSRQQGLHVDPVDHIYQAWDAALGARDLDASMGLYQPDATLESPLVRHLPETEDGVVRGREDLRTFVAKVFANEPPERQRFRSQFLTDGDRVVREYPRVTDDGEQMDIVEVMELRDGLIERHRVHRGWNAVRLYEQLRRAGRLGNN